MIRILGCCQNMMTIFYTNVEHCIFVYDKLIGLVLIPRAQCVSQPFSCESMRIRSQEIDWMSGGNDGLAIAMAIGYQLAEWQPRQYSTDPNRVQFTQYLDNI